MRSFCKHSVLVSGGSLHCHCNVGDNVCYQPLSSHPQSSIKLVKITKIFDMCCLYSSKLSVSVGKKMPQFSLAAKIPTHLFKSRL